MNVHKASLAVTLSTHGKVPHSSRECSDPSSWHASALGCQCVTAEGLGLASIRAAVIDTVAQHPVGPASWWPPGRKDPQKSSEDPTLLLAAAAQPPGVSQDSHLAAAAPQPGLVFLLPAIAEGQSLIAWPPFRAKSSAGSSLRFPQSPHRAPA